MDRLLAVIHNRNLTLFARIDHSDLARGVGLTMQEAHVLIFGNPKGGTPLMIASPLLALDLPLKVLVWQSQDAQVRVSTTSVAYLSERYALPQELVGNLAVVVTIIQQALYSERFCWLDSVLLHPRGKHGSEKSFLLREDEIQHESRRKREVTRNTTISTFCCQKTSSRERQ